MASSRRYFETDLSQSRLEHRGPRRQSAQSGRAAGIARCARAARLADLRDRSAGLQKSGVVPQPGGGSGNRAVSDAAIDAHRPRGKGTGTSARGAQGTADHRHRHPVLCRGGGGGGAAGDSASPGRGCRVERELGRVRAVPKGPRTIDIDILFYAAAVVETARLEIPHPRIAERRFVLEPLAELAPDLRHPVTHRSVRQMLESAPPAVVRLLT